MALVDSLLQEVYAALLRKMGFTRVTVADDGQHAVDQVDKADFDVILMVNYLGPVHLQADQANLDHSLRFCRMLRCRA